MGIGVKVNVEGRETVLVTKEEDKDAVLPLTKEVVANKVPGKTVKEIVALTGLKESTVRFHNRNIYTKLGVHSLKQLLRYSAIMKQEEGEGKKQNGIS